MAKITLHGDPFFDDSTVQMEVDASHIESVMTAQPPVPFYVPPTALESDKAVRFSTPGFYPGNEGESRATPVRYTPAGDIQARVIAGRAPRKKLEM